MAPDDFDGGATYLFSGFTPDTDNLDGGGGGCFVRLVPFGLAMIGDHLVSRKDGADVPASSINVGEELSMGGAVTSIEIVRRMGVLAPITEVGSIVVNEV